MFDFFDGGGILEIRPSEILSDIKASVIFSLGVVTKLYHRGFVLNALHRQIFKDYGTSVLLWLKIAQTHTEIEGFAHLATLRNLLLEIQVAPFGR